jgi:hypothetical protein
MGSDEAVEREFDVLMERAGVPVRADCRAGTLAAYRDMKRMTELLRQPRTAAAEPSNIFTLTPFLRG